MNVIPRFFLVPLLFLGLVASAHAADRIGKIKVASGEVKILRDGVEITAEKGGELFEDDVITTGENSAVGMTFSDNSRVSLGPNTSLGLEKYAHAQSGKKDEFDLRLQQGSLTASSGDIAKSRPLAMRVLMPTTVLGVKGTQFAVRVGGDG
ncbi:MAG: FecR domain-containing protein [Pseudomonadota bacterium]